MAVFVLCWKEKYVCEHKVKNIMKIGIFDSGFGGLSIMRAIVAAMPQHDYVYLGDAARTPYGTRSPEAVHKFTQQAVRFLFAEGCEYVIIACNTASAEALPRLQKIYGDAYAGKLSGVMAPTIDVAVAQTKNGKIGVLATEGAVASNAFARGIRQQGEGVTVVQSACPLFVPLVENGEDNKDVLRYYAEKYTTPLLNSGVDTIILGCTHYEFLAPVIQDVVGSDVTLICEGPVVAQQFAQQCQGMGSIDKDTTVEGSRIFYTTDYPVKFAQQGRLFYGAPIAVKRVAIDD